MCLYSDMIIMYVFLYTDPADMGEELVSTKCGKDFFQQQLPYI